MGLNNVYKTNFGICNRWATWYSIEGHTGNMVSFVDQMVFDTITDTSAREIKQLDMKQRDEILPITL